MLLCSGWSAAKRVGRAEKGGKGGAHDTLRKKRERARERERTREREAGLRGSDRRELLARADGTW